MRRASLRYVGVGALLVTGACTSSDPDPVPAEPGATHPAVRRARVAVDDAGSTGVTVIDTEFQEIRATLSMPGEVTALQPSFTGNLGVAYTREGLSFFTAGVSIVDHTGEGWEGNEHIHVYKFAPELLDFSLEAGARASSHGERWAGFVEGPAGEPSEALTFDELPLIQNDTPTPMRAPLAHHTGLAVPLDDGGLITTVVDDMMPATSGLARLDAEGTETGREMGCTAPQAMERIGDLVVTTCEEGWWLVQPDDSGGLQADPVAYGHGGGAPTELVVHLDGELVAARVGDELSWVDPAALTAGTTPLPPGTCDVVYERETAASVLVLAWTGFVHAIDPKTGEAVQEPVEVAPGFACDDAVRPHLAAAPRLAFVTVPSTGEVVELDASTLVERVRYAVGGQPNRVAVLGLDPRNRNAGFCFTCQ